jgi:hypothetical protein
MGNLPSFGFVLPTMPGVADMDAELEDIYGTQPPTISQQQPDEDSEEEEEDAIAETATTNEPIYCYEDNDPPSY